MDIIQNVAGFTPEGEAVVYYTMTAKNGTEAVLCNLGATLVALRTPDRDGHIADVVLGYDNWEDYRYDAPFHGKTVGRFANRIAKGCFTLNGKEYALACNNGPNHLHGGPNGFAEKLWNARVETDRVVFSLVSPDGDEGYPAEVGVETVYDLSDDGVLEINYFARSDDDTLLNLTNHTYFNLAGHDSGTILEQTLKLNCEGFLPTDSGLIPTGEVAPVAGTPMDFLQAKPIGRDIRAQYEPLLLGKGYDHCFTVKGWQPAAPAQEAPAMMDVAELCDPASGRKLKVRSTQPAVQIYSGNFLATSPRKGKGGCTYPENGGVAIECQGYPDAPNQPQFPAATLKKGETYRHTIEFAFSAE